MAGALGAAALPAPPGTASPGGFGSCLTWHLSPNLQWPFWKFLHAGGSPALLPPLPPFLTT
eukprot:6904588-Lingulodinium_polyedra.AAC.1